MHIIIRKLVMTDIKPVLQLNQTEALFVKDLTKERQKWVSDNRCICLGAYVDEELAGFLMALPSGMRYGSPNYSWFSDRYDKFLYVDRVVVVKELRGKGIAKKLFEELILHASRLDVRTICSEFDKEPLNKESYALHRSKNFNEVGLRVSLDSGSVISMQLCKLTN